MQPSTTNMEDIEDMIFYCFIFLLLYEYQMFPCSSKLCQKQINTKNNFPINPALAVETFDKTLSNTELTTSHCHTDKTTNCTNIIKILSDLHQNRLLILYIDMCNVSPSIGRLVNHSRLKQPNYIWMHCIVTWYRHSCPPLHEMS